MQPLTIFGIVFAYATRSEAFPLNETETDTRALEFNVNIKEYPGLLTTTTEESFLDQIGGSISKAYEGVKSAFADSEESEKKVKLLYPAHYLVHYPHLHPFLSSLLINHRLPNNILKKNIAPGFYWNSSTVTPNAPEEVEEKKVSPKIHYFINNVGRLIAKELPESYEEDQQENAANPNRNYFNIHLQGLDQNSSELATGLDDNTGRNLY